MPATRTRRAPVRRLAPLRLDQRLILNQYMLRLFGVESFQTLAEDLKDPNYELLDEDNVSNFYHALVARFPNLQGNDPAGPSRDDLRRYDDNIVRHTLTISHARDERIRWKYFQYLALLFTEIYLDRFFAAPQELLADLNALTTRLNATTLKNGPIDEFHLADLRKLAFWMATGSGKTLLMHVNILQFRHYLALHRRENEINRIILVTPNEGLSNQHLDEFAKSGMPAELFAKAGNSIFSGHAVEIIDIHKLAEDSGEKTVAVDAFERNNLVLVDEGHRGAGGQEWKDKRDRLSAEGFTFEYSATFGQAIKAAGKEELAQEYARAILFDYSYRFFYADGYGKDYQILNLADEDGGTEHLYLTAGLLSFYQQLRVFEEHREHLREYGVERPLWVFVGSSVTQKLGKAEGTDIQRILDFFDRFVREREESLHLLERLMSGNTGLVDGGRDIFAGKFAYLAQQRISSNQLFTDILQRLFNASNNAHLRIEELKGADGELALRLGDAEPFGVINIGDARGLAKLLDKDPTLDVMHREVAGSVFSRLSDPESRVDVLIGSKKFTEGWNSYRVSSLGLMNVGRSEGAQIIQLFGRGVRLRGHDGSLKRSSAVPGLKPPESLRYLETLSIYGLRADYMAQFKQFLEEEGLPTNDDVKEVNLPVVRLLPHDRALKTIRIPDGHDFRRDGPRIGLAAPSPEFARRPITLDCHPKLQVMVSNGILGIDPTALEEDHCFEPAHLAFLDVPALYVQLVRYKEDRGWSNLTISPDAVAQTLATEGWYRLTIPAAALTLDGPSPLRRIRLWQDIALSLLKKYVDRFYKNAREAYEAPLREYAVLTEEDRNFFSEYQVMIHQAQQYFLPVLLQIKEDLESGEFEGAKFGNLHVFTFDRHLYSPLVHLGSRTKDLEIKPAPLNEGERNFVVDLKSFFQRNPEFFVDRELYLLRNMTRGKGVGFFEAGNFFPDFILWLLESNRQLITFIDPKGIVRLESGDDPKIQFHRTIKDIEREMGDPSIALNSFIVANTPFANVAWWGLTKDDLQNHHVLFQQDDRNTYIEAMFRRMGASPT